MLQLSPCMTAMLTRNDPQQNDAAGMPHSPAKDQDSSTHLEKLATFLKDTVVATLVKTTEDTQAQLCVGTHIQQTTDTQQLMMGKSMPRTPCNTADNVLGGFLRECFSCRKALFSI